MSLYDKASIALIPSGTKASKLYSVLPANGDGDFTHSRGSTATRVNKDGLIESVATNVPRLDYPLTNGVVGDCPHLLLEPSRTNQLQRTEEFDNSYWTKNNLTITSNQIVSPDGSQTADKYTHGGSSASNYIYGSAGSVTSGNQYTFSVFVKKGTGTFVQILFGSGAFGSLHQNFDIENGLIGGSSGDATAFIDEYPNGWYRVGITDTCTTTQSSGTAIISLAQSNTSSRLSSFTSSDNFYVWGAQVEQGSYPTSYISWDGSGTTTRSADVCSGSGTSAEFNDTESSLFVEIQGLAEDNTNRYISISDGGASPYTNSVAIQYRNNGTLRIFHNGLDFADAILISGASFDQTVSHKIAVRFKENDMKVYIDGVSQSLNSSFVYQSISGLNTFKFTQPFGTSLGFVGKVKQAIVFNEALSDSELETLTS